MHQYYMFRIPPVRFRIFSSIKVTLEEGRLLWHIFTSLQQQVNVLVGKILALEPKEFGLSLLFSVFSVLTNT